MSTRCNRASAFYVKLSRFDGSLKKSGDKLADLIHASRSVEFIEVNLHLNLIMLDL